MEAIVKIKQQLTDFNTNIEKLTLYENNLQAILTEIATINECWSNSWIGFHASLYYLDLTSPPPWQHKFDSEWGSINGIPDYWIERNLSEIDALIFERSGFDYKVILPEIDKIVDDAENIRESFITDLAVIKADSHFTDEWKLVDEEIKEYRWGVTANEIVEYKRPRQMISRDSFAIHQGLKIPPHIIVEGHVIAATSKISSIQTFIKKCTRVIKLIEIKSQTFNSAVGANRNDIEFVLKICDKFHLVARQLRSRYNTRTTIEINDEYDTQDLFHGLLKLFFDDIRKEEWNPSYAGGSTRSDFLLKSQQIVVEVKKTRPSMTDKDLGEQLIIDIAKYKVHPDCKKLICFVYDPEGRVGNPSGIEEDLNRMSTDDMLVLVKIIPK